MAIHSFYLSYRKYIDPNITPCNLCQCCNESRSWGFLLVFTVCGVSSGAGCRPGTSAATLVDLASSFHTQDPSIIWLHWIFPQIDGKKNILFNMNHDFLWRWFIYETADSYDYDVWLKVFIFLADTICL